MKIEGEYAIKAPQRRVWHLLTDPAILRRCIPGCEKLEAEGEDTYAATLNVGIASVKGTYSGKVKLTDKQPFSHFKLLVEGQGAQGFVRGEGAIDLREGNEGTIVVYNGDAQVGGTIASVGQRMLQGAAKMMVNQFFAALDAEAQAAPWENPKHGFFRDLLRMVLAWIRRTFKS